MLETKAVILDVSQGEIKHIIIGDSVYETRLIGPCDQVEYGVGEAEEAKEFQNLKEDISREMKRLETEQMQPMILDLGAFVKTVDNVPIYENPLFEFRNIESRGEAVRIIREFFPEIADRDVTLFTKVYLAQAKGACRSRKDLGRIIKVVNGVTLYEHLYDRIKAGETPERVVRHCYPHISYKSVLSYARSYKNEILLEEHPELANVPEKKKTTRKYTKKKDIIGRSKTYSCNITKNMFDRVSNALRKYDFVPTSDNISKEAQLSLTNVRATLDYMKEQKLITKKVSAEGIITYQLV